MYKKDYIVISYFLFVDLHLKLVMSHQLKHSLWNIFIYNQKTTCSRHNFIRSRVMLINSLFWNLLITLLKISLFDFRWFYWKIFIVHLQPVANTFTSCSAVQKQFLKTIRYVTLSFTMIYLEWSVDTHLISLFFICSIGHQSKNNLLRQLFFKFNLESTNT